MFDWVKLALLVLGLIDKVLDWQHGRGMIDEGRRQALLEATMLIAGKVATRNQIMEQVNALSGKEVDAGLRGLEPK